MKNKIVFLIVLFITSISLSACAYRYSSESYNTTDSYNEVFRDRRVPQDVR